jgi:two-component system response regulator CpxR
MTRILIIDHDPASWEIVADCFKPEGFVAVWIRDGRNGLQQILEPEVAYDMILLSVALPGIGGIEILQRIRSAGYTPVIMFAGPDQEEQQIAALEAGADDVLVKPFSRRELVARVRAILRRTKRHFEVDVRGSPLRIVLGDIELDTGSRTVRRNGEELALTAAEFGCLEILIKAGGHTVSREEFVSHVLGGRPGTYDRSVDVHVGRLRRKLGDRYDGIERIRTVRGIGYAYAVNGERRGE